MAREILEWLEKLGMSEYAERFAENRIDLAVLRDVTDQDLKDIGVVLGDRRKILRAIAELENAAAAGTAAAPSRLAAAPRPAPSAAPMPAPATTAEAAGERRYLTVMFCDLVGSTGIAAQLDAEEWRDLVGAYLDAASAAVTEMGGHVAKKLGDGILALFGYPVAHENDAERAARAALAIQRALADLNRKNAGTSKPDLKARIGLDTGPAVVDVAGEIYGDVANVAARVQAQAESGAVLVTARVQRQVAGLFVAEDRGTHALKGVPEPTALFRLVRASGGGRRSGQRNLTPLVGRDDEMAMLLRRWERARQGDGQLVMIVGEPGLGKSRLIEEFHARLSDTPHTWVEWSCSQLLQNTPLHPIAEWGRARFGGADVPAERRLAELESSLSQVKLDPAENVPLVAPLLDIPLPQGRTPALAPEELRRRQLAALTNWVMAGAKVQPVVLAFEDLHWADPTTLDVLRGIAERGALAPLLIVATTRPEFRPPWSMRSHHGTISLTPLDRAQVRDMVAELSARHALPRDVVEDVAARTGGVPLFVEEVTRLLLERGEGAGGIEAIPPTLQQSLMARLDRLGPAREVAQIGSVIGRGFSYTLLRDVAGTEDAALQAALEKLAEADIVLVQGLPPESDYRFKHALIQDAAYENLLKRRRQVLHRRVAEILRDRFADTAAAEPEVLAHHFTRAGMTDQAIEWWGKAGDQALRRSAFQEAISHLGKAIEMADKSGEGTARAASALSTASPGQRLKLQTSYGQALMWSKGYAAPETAAAFARAQELAGGGEDTSERFVTYYGQIAGMLLRAELTSARQISEKMLRDAASHPNSPEALAAHRLLALTYLSLGDFAEAEVQAEHALRIDDSGWDRDAKLRYGQDSRIAAIAYLATASWQLGEAERARELIEKALARALESAHVPTIANSYHFIAGIEAFRGDAEAVLRVVGPLVETSREHSLELYQLTGLAYRGWSRARLGEYETGVAELRQALADLGKTGNKLWVPLFRGFLAEIEADAQNTGAALTRIDEALAIVREIGTHWTAAFLHRIRGEILRKRDPANTALAEKAFLTAIAVAQQQKAKSFELQAALSLAKLYQSTNRAADAHAVLAPALEGFAPTPEFPEIEQAQALLAALAETEEVKNAAAARQRRLKLQTAYGNALISARGYQAPETTAAFARARELASGIEDASERFSVFYGQWAGSFVRAELPAMRELADTLLRETRPKSPEAGIAHRLSGETEWFAGDLVDARDELERALALFDPERDRELAFRFGQDVIVTATAFLATVVWPLGEVDRGRALADDMVAQAVRGRHVPTIVWARVVGGIFDLMCRSPSRAASHMPELIALANEHGMKLWIAFASFLDPWARAGADGANLKDMRSGLEMLRQQGVLLYRPIFATALAEAEMHSGAIDTALATIDAAIADTERNEQRWFEAETRRIRGEILWRRDPANTAPAEEAFLTAIAVAQQQKAKSFELRAALSLAKLYQLARRAAEAHAILATALAGFSPTPEFPEIEEAQKLLATLAATDEVRTATATRRQRVELQVAYANALISARGHGATETTAAFARARDLAADIEDPAERFPIYYGIWVGSLVRGELPVMRDIAEAAGRDAENNPSLSEACTGWRIVGLTRWYEGDFVAARASLEKTLAAFDPERDRDLAFRFVQDIGVSATIQLAQTLWAQGEIHRANDLAIASVEQADRTGHVATMVYAHCVHAFLLVVRRDPARAAVEVGAFAALARKHAMPVWIAYADFLEPWARWHDGHRDADLGAMRAGIAHAHEQKITLYVPLLETALASAEAEADQFEAAFASIDHALAETGRTGQRWFEAETHRVRGEILLKHDPANTALAEEAFLTAVAIAQQEKAKSFELRAAHSLAKLYQSSGRPADAHAVLAPALEGFSPTPEFPEIEEAQRLLDSIGS